jgi:hypothetical protein
MGKVFAMDGVLFDLSGHKRRSSIKINMEFPSSFQDKWRSMSTYDGRPRELENYVNTKFDPGAVTLVAQLGSDPWHGAGI